MHYCFKL